MKKLLYFASDYKIGLSGLLTDQLKSLSKSGVQVYAVAGENCQEPGLYDDIKNHCIDIEIIQGLDEHTRYINLVRRIERIIIRENINLIHVQNNWQLAIAGIVKNKLRFRQKIEIAYTLHGFRHNSPIKSRIAQLVIGSGLFLFADHIICMTDYLVRKFRLLSYKIDLIPLGIKDDFFIPEFQPPRTDALHMIFPAQFREGKNQDMIIRAFKTYIEETSDTHSTLTLPGDGPLLGSIKKLVYELNIENQVFFPGLVSKNRIKELYLDSNIAIVASNSETFGQSIVEPYVLGRCVVSTPVGIAPEIIKDSENGFIFENEHQLTSILKKLSNNNSTTLIGRNNFDQRMRFNWDNITSIYIEKLKLSNNKQ